MDEHGHGQLTYSGTPVPKRMGQLGAISPLKHVRGFFYPVKEKPEIQAQLDEIDDELTEPQQRARRSRAARRRPRTRSAATSSPTDRPEGCCGY